MKQVFSLLLAALLLFSACTGTAENPSPDPETAARSDTPPETETIPEEWGEEAGKLLSSPWKTVSPGSVGSLTYENGSVVWNLSRDGRTETVSGPPSFDGNRMTVDGRVFTFETLAAFCLLTEDGVSVRLKKAADTAEARQAFELVTHRWEGDGASLSFDGERASLILPGGGITGRWSLGEDGVLTVTNDGVGKAGGNLALRSKITASSTETADFPPELAVDGDPGTRYSSEYHDPEWLLMDLGRNTRIGCAVLTFETAYSSEFKFEVSEDGSHWTEAAHVKGNAVSGADIPITVPFSRIFEARYVRYTGLARGTDWGHSIYELELYESLPGTYSVAVAFTEDGIVLDADGEKMWMKSTD